jgi:hypothetical protein
MARSCQSDSPFLSTSALASTQTRSLPGTRGMADHGVFGFLAKEAAPDGGGSPRVAIADEPRRVEAKKKAARPQAADRSQTEFITHDQESLPFGRDMRVVRLEEHLRRCLDGSGEDKLNAAFLSHAAETFHVTEGDVMRVYDRLIAPAVSVKQ